MSADLPEHTPRGPLFWTCAVVGAGMIGFGIGGAWIDRADTHPFELAIWLAGAGVVHDFALAPAVVLLALATRWLPDVARTPARIGLAVSALVTLMFWPFVRGWGRQPSVPSALPLDYGRNLIIVLVLIWAAVAIATAARWLGRRR